MRTAIPLLIVLLTATGCDRRVVGPSAPSTPTPPSAPTPPSPTPSPPPIPPPPPPGAVAVYLATFVASGSCTELPIAVRERTYVATLFRDGRIEWTGPTLNPSPGHLPISTGSLTDDAFSFSVDVERDPQSDDFHGISDDTGNGTFLNISGEGIGSVHEGDITGTFNGLFAFYEPFLPPRPDIWWVIHYCKAADHRFRFIRQ